VLKLQDFSVLPDAAVLIMRSTSEHLGLPRLTGAKVRIWYRNHGAKELRLASHVQFLL
jgi:hypothetical protein